jgi:hypothetical protein
MNSSLSSRYRNLAAFKQWNISLPSALLDRLCAKNSPDLPLLWKNLISVDESQSESKVYEACLTSENGSCVDVIVKLIPIEETDLNLFKTIAKTTSLDLQHTIETLWTIPSLCEVYLQLLFTELLRNKVSPNFSWSVNWGSCTESPSSSSLVLINEKANMGSLRNWCSVSDWNVLTWKSALFQIFSALWLLQKYFDLTHHDLHWGNVLVQHVPKGGYFHYCIEGIDYLVPNQGYIFTLSDFGNVHVPNKIVNHGYLAQDTEKRYSLDYFRISHSIVWSANEFWDSKVDKSLGNLYTQIKDMYTKNMTLDVVIPRIFHDFQSSASAPSSLVHGTFNLDQPLDFLSPEYQFLLRYKTKEDGPVWYSGL